MKTLYCIVSFYVVASLLINISLFSTSLTTFAAPIPLTIISTHTNIKRIQTSLATRTSGIGTKKYSYFGTRCFLPAMISLLGEADWKQGGQLNNLTANIKFS